LEALDDARARGATLLQRMHTLLTAGFIDRTKKDIFGIIFDYMDPDWRQVLETCRPPPKKIEPGRKAAWSKFIKRSHRLSNKGLRNVYDSLKESMTGFKGDSAQLFTHMQVAMMSSMEKMIQVINKQLRTNLEEVWSFYETKAGSLEIAEWETLCRDNLLVEIEQVPNNEELILEQAIINAVKPLEVMDTKTGSKEIELQKQAAKRSVVAAKSMIIGEHVNDIRAKLDNIKAYCTELQRDMDLGRDRIVTKTAFIQYYLIARAGVKSEKETLASRKYNGAT